VNGRRYRSTTDTTNKQQAKDIEARERSRILEGRHGIRRQPDVTFKELGATYLRDHAKLNMRSGARDEYAINALNRTFGPLILHEITAHRIEQSSAPETDQKLQKMLRNLGDGGGIENGGVST
jgi:hypothetical protein